MRTFETDVKTSARLVKDSAPWAMDASLTLTDVYGFEAEAEELWEIQDLYDHAAYCLRRASTLVEKHYGGKVDWTPDGWVWIED